MRAKLDPGELDCYAYSVGMDIDAIISNDKGAKEIIVTHSDKLVITFWDLLILAVKTDNISWEEGEVYYNQVVRKCSLRLPPFGVQVKLFDEYCGKHQWTEEYLTSQIID